MVCKAELLCIGNELLIGKTTNTNATWLSDRITRLGGDVTRVTVVGDEIKTIGAAIRETLRRNPDLVITSGGLGPTFDDKTLLAFSKTLRRSISLNKNALKMIRSKYTRILGRKNMRLTQPRLKMAMLPAGAKPIHNPVGTAPAVTLTERGIKFVILPGVPAELQAIFNKTIADIVRAMAGRQFFYETSITVFGLPESQIAPLIDQVMEKMPTVYIKSHAKGGEGSREGLIELHFSTKSNRKATAMSRTLRAVTMMSELLGTASSGSYGHSGSDPR